MAKISNWLHAGVFKIYTKGFCFSTTAFFNNIYIIAIVKQFFELFLFAILLFWMSIISLFSIKHSFVKNGWINFQKLLLVVKPFSVSFSYIFFSEIRRNFFALYMSFCFLSKVFCVFYFSTWLGYKQLFGVAYQRKVHNYLPLFFFLAEHEHWRPLKICHSKHYSFR